MSEDIKIVPIAEEYSEGLRNAIDLVAKERRFFNFFEGFPLDETIEIVKNNIENDVAQFVAVDGEQVVGWCDIRPKGSSGIDNHIGGLGMGVLPEYRGKGIGKKLVLATLEKAKKQFTRIQLWVFEDNNPAFDLYKSVGFEVEGIGRNVAKMDGVYKSTHMMSIIVEENS